MKATQHAVPITAPTPCVVEAAVESQVTFPDGGTLDRAGFHAWLWEQADGLLGIDEGAVTAADAAALGLTPAGLVIDTAAAPADRDWVATLAVATEEWWFGDECRAREAVTLVAGMRGCRVRVVRVAAAIDHEQAARDSFTPIAVQGFGVVSPAWNQGGATVAADGSATIFIEPGTGFGTGLHETTQLCLAAVAARHRRGDRLGRVLDFGSGSGIVGIAAAVLGAGHVDAVEIDDHVHDAIRANAKRNAVAERMHVARVLPAASEPYDLVIANIVAPVLMEHAASLCAAVNPRTGTVVLSGLLADDVPRVVGRYASLLGSSPLVREQGMWRCLAFDAG